MKKQKFKENQTIRAIEKAIEGLSRAEKDFSRLFPSCLILNCLAEADHTPTKRLKNMLAQELAEFILKNRSNYWSWNYGWKNYPEDLDDTACALIALQKSGAVEITPEIMACFAQHLISAEIQEGGPYRTWLDKGLSHIQENNSRNDADIVVNANIGYFLNLQNIKLENLDAFLKDSETGLKTQKINSLYYRSVPVILYFLSRCIQIDKELLKTMAINPLETACLLCAIIRNEEKFETRTSRSFSENQKIKLTYVNLLLETQLADGLWPACPMYIEETKANKTSYYQSSVLTTAFCIEALSLYLNQRVDSNDNEIEDTEENILAEIRFRLKETAGADKFIDRFKNNDMEKFITLLPFRFFRALKIQNTKVEDTKKTISRSYLIELGTANMLGWIGYTIQDDILDEKKSIADLPLSNIFIRKSLRIFDTEYASQIFDKIDTANAREATGNFDTENLADKSFGHALGPLTICSILGNGPKTPTFKSIEGFFKHYIIARQMSDDAHDWEQDLQQGRLNSASVHLTNEVRTANQKNHVEIDALRQIFWNKTIDKIARAIHYHLALARNHASNCRDFIDNNYLNSLLEPIECSALKAVSERNKSVDFVSRFK